MITDINHINLAVCDLETSFSFYKDVLGLKPLVKWHEGAYFLAGCDWICLFEDHERKGVGTLSCYTHVAFSVSLDDFEILSKCIQDSGAPIWKNNQSEGASLYFCDPNGHKLEIHVGDWQSRLASKKASPGTWKNVEWF
ncbi:VOC family protein [Candidatus Bealeia paramacronuclearis]|uniref:VOC family protein n=1 Tax=Candidatus Bealeia paramacronuclearis TaxID=1921001 RepID=A0ABZ2C1F6_9PROT|nr:VOC family protein [Candidatus Bealeia paramacronuclearis]